MKVVSSRTNPLFKHLLRISRSSAERRKWRQSLLDGVHLIEAYCAALGMPEAIVVSADGLENAEIGQLLQRLAPLEPVKFSEGLFNEVAPVQTPTGIVALIATPEALALPPRLDFCLLLDEIQDPGNLGSILRTAAAAGVEHVLLSKGCAFAWAPRVIRAGMGAHFHLRIYEGMDLLGVIRHFDGPVIATSSRAAKTLYEVELSGRLALLIGNEGAGVGSQLLEAATERVRIPMPGAVESLNAAAAAAICLFERVRQLERVAWERSRTARRVSTRASTHP